MNIVVPKHKYVYTRMYIQNVHMNIHTIYIN